MNRYVSRKYPQFFWHHFFRFIFCLKAPKTFLSWHELERKNNFSQSLLFFLFLKIFLWLRFLLCRYVLLSSTRRLLSLRRGAHHHVVSAVVRPQQQQHSLYFSSTTVVSDNNDYSHHSHQHRHHHPQNESTFGNNNNNNHNHNSNNSSKDLSDLRTQILKQALMEVHHHGWTNDALAAAACAGEYV